MKDEKRPIDIEGKTYLVDETFSGHPAIYKVVANNKVEHVEGSNQTTVEVALAGLKPGQVIIIAHTA